VLRRSALNSFADPMAVIDGLRRAPLVRSRQHGTFGLRDIELATGLAEEPPPQAARPNAAAQNVPATSARMPTEVCLIMFVSLRLKPRRRCRWNCGR